MPTALIWFRDDLRLDDNPALKAALTRGFTPVCVYVHAPNEEAPWAPGAASDAWRHRSLATLDADLTTRGARLHFARGPSLPALRRYATAAGATAVFWNRRYEPALEARDATIKRALRADGLLAESFNGALLFEPWEIETRQGDPYKVFTPYWKACQALARTPRAWDAPARLPPATPLADTLALGQLSLSPRRGWDRGFWDHWRPGEHGAKYALEAFIADGLAGYAERRDLPADTGTSRLSPHLHFGEISVHRILARLDRGDLPAAQVEAFRRQLAWRDFAHHLMHFFPHTAERNLNPRFNAFDWADEDTPTLDAWRHGRTGVPVIDAGMRELWTTGTMHNRVRMLVASFLTKHLRQHWLHGARWFWDTLVDADLANNSMGWQWVAGTGADAAPYFRVFNPVLQARKFDPEGAYLRRWLPELAGLPDAALFAPWEHAALLARAAPDYPRAPIVGIAEGRERALAAYQRLRTPG